MPSPHPRPSRRDSWPPTRMRLHLRPGADADAAGEPQSEQDGDPELAFIDDDPLNYFLEPAPLLDGGDSDDDDDGDLIMLDLDAGIENPKRPPPIVRSVSPSSLGGLSRPPPRHPSPPSSASLLQPPTPPRTPPALSRSPPLPDEDDEDEDDGEEYVRLTGGTSLPFSLRDFATLRAKRQERSGSSSGSNSGSGRAKASASPLLSVPARPGPSVAVRGRSAVARPTFAGPRRAHSWSGARRTTMRAWREPSPDVWSIEEEEEEHHQQEEEDLVESEGGELGKTVETARAKKKVRFVLPVMEVIP
ncbi:hypothetical protein NKR23_g6992 [Pleurostoma richardsiae]|uniref:Uncharacterized protein n=1 Tax=Pleurostoma richardsiae TaxID=41990 RepID=A0AA38VNA3_9PEZI|nr:hypothetical protein NKR23_g6992 [Pleurostoma richardsiae]